MSDEIPTSHRVTFPGDPSPATTAALARDLSALERIQNAKVEGIHEALVTRINAVEKAQETVTANLTRVPTETQRAVSSLEALINERFVTINVRLDDMDKAVQVVGLIRDRIPAEMAALILQHEAVYSEKFLTIREHFKGDQTTNDEKFRGIQVQFSERGVREEEKATLLQTALAAALQAQKESAGTQTQTFKEAIAESKAATTKQIDALGDLLRTTSGSLNNKLDVNQQNTDGKISDLKERLQAIESLGVGRNSAITDQRSSASETRGYILLGFSAISVLLAVVVFILSH